MWGRPASRPHDFEARASSQYRYDPPQHLGRRLRSGGEEGGEVEVAFAAGEIAEAADHDAGRAELGGDLRHGGALHFHGLSLEAVEEPLARRLAVDELVAGKDRAEADRRLPRNAAGHRGRQWWQGEAIETFLQAESNLGGEIEAEAIARFADGRNARAKGLDVAADDGAVIVLDEAIGDHDVADAEGGIDAAGDTGEKHAAAAEMIEQQRGHQRRVDLADAGFDQHHRHAVEPALAEGVAAAHDLVVDRQGVPKVTHLLRQGRDNAERTGRRAHVSLAVRNSAPCARAPTPCRRP